MGTNALPEARTRVPLRVEVEYPISIYRPDHPTVSSLYCSIDVAAGVYLDLPSLRNGQHALTALDGLIGALQEFRRQITEAQAAPCLVCDAPLSSSRHLPCSSSSSFCGTQDCHVWVETKSVAVAA